MSKPMMRSKPAAAEVRTAPTMPPAGPDRIASLPSKRRRGVFKIQRHDDLAARANAFLDLDHPRIKHLRQHDVALEDARPVLVGDAQCIAEAARDAEHRGFALALEERIGR